MANARTSSTAGGDLEKFEEASVDIDPGASGYGCNAVPLHQCLGYAGNGRVHPWDQLSF